MTTRTMYSKYDAYGRAYLRLDEAQPGIVELDDGFTCHAKGKTMLYKGETGYYFNCHEGQHYISGQADDGIHCVGIYPIAQDLSQ